MATSQTAAQARAQDSAFVTQCNFHALKDLLPLLAPTHPHIPPSPKTTYRSFYTYQGWQDLEDPATWLHLSLFDLVLCLVDFSPLRDTLAYLLGWRSARGHPPFDPISFFLLIGWQLHNGWNRSQTLKNLSKPRYADYARSFGFQEGQIPTEGGVRYFLTALGRPLPDRDLIIPVPLDEGADPEQVALHRLNYLLSQTAILLVQAGLVSPEAWEQALICPDGMIHLAASRMRCASVTDTCYQPTNPQHPRPCPAKEKERPGCDCDTSACAQACQRATPRDPAARAVVYQASNKHSIDSDSPNPQAPTKNKKKRLFYGYRSLPLELAEWQRRFHLVLLNHFQPANLHEELPAAALLRALPHFYPTLQVDAVAGDAGLGYRVVLHTIYHHLQARRVVDLRAHQTDKNRELWPIRGYDDQGRPVCSYGYAFTGNGFDRQRHRYKWFCAQTCRQPEVKPRVQVADAAYPPQECPFLGETLPFGEIRNITDKFPDGSMRLVRDVPKGSPQWKTLYHRARNAVEARNASMERWNLKRLPVYGQERTTALIFLADAWDTLTTLARLVREATAATRA